jgi:SAM-dependent methyltransferase
MTQLAIPPADMMFLATAGRDKDVFLATGLADRDHVLSFLNAAGVRPQADRGQADRLRILDWGCGCGRIARHWEPFASKVELHGCDVAAEPIRWCQENLPFGRFAVSGHNPPLPYTDGQFDAVYATSVLTHLTFDSQYRWMQELWRVLKPGGVAVLTAHGPTLLPNILPGLVNASGERVSTILIDEELFLCVEYDVGSNQTGNMMTHAVLARIFAPFSLVTHRPRHGLMGIQDTYVFAKKDGTSPVVTDESREHRRALRRGAKPGAAGHGGQAAVPCHRPTDRPPPRQRHGDRREQARAAAAHAGLDRLARRLLQPTRREPAGIDGRRCRRSRRVVRSPA